VCDLGSNPPRTVTALRGDAVARMRLASLVLARATGRVLERRHTSVGDNIKVDLKKRVVDWTSGRAVVNTVVNQRVP
jgi:hypothetical protein